MWFWELLRRLFVGDPTTLSGALAVLRKHGPLRITNHDLTVRDGKLESSDFEVAKQCENNLVFIRYWRYWRGKRLVERCDVWVLGKETSVKVFFGNGKIVAWKSMGVHGRPMDADDYYCAHQILCAVKKCCGVG